MLRNFRVARDSEGGVMKEYLDDFDIDYSDDPTCPYCGHKTNDTCEMDHSESTFQNTCGHCDKVYLCNANIIISWSSQKADCLNTDEDTHLWTEWELVFKDGKWEQRRCKSCDSKETREIETKLDRIEHKGE